MTLILEALARHLGDAEPVDGFSAKKLRSYYLLNPLESGERRYKLLLTQTDKDTLLSLVEQKTLPDEHSSRIQQNFCYFEERLREPGTDISALCNGLAKLLMVDISLDKDQDRPQLIFESMNSTGRELSQADLIRNFILMDLEPKIQEQLYREHWRPMEIAFGQEAYLSHFDGFMRHYLTLQTGEIPNLRAVYDAFKAHTRKPEVAEAGVAALVAEIHTFASYYCAMALGKETEEHLAEAFDDLRELSVDVAYPLLLELYDDYHHHLLSAQDFLYILRLVEAYVFRRAVCGIPTNSLNRTFATFGRAIKRDRYLDSIRSHFLTLPSYRRFPNDQEFQMELKRRDLYNFGRRSYWLRRLENHERKERVPVAEYTIEHILPQNKDLPSAWRDDLGPEWQRVQETWLHTLGNLTLTGYNAEYSDRPFAEKRDTKGGFKESPLRLNEGLGVIEKWNESTIIDRANRLALQAARVWSAPKLDNISEDFSISEMDQNLVPTVGNADIEADEHIVVLLGALRKEVLSLDACVTEEASDHALAFAAETDFLITEPLKDRIRLSLQIGFHELDDPRALAKERENPSTAKGSLVELEFNNLDELPYVKGLVRQAFEKQMVNGDG